MVIGVLVLKEIYNLTDQEALERLEWDTLWHYALDLTAYFGQGAHSDRSKARTLRSQLSAM